MPQTAVPEHVSKDRLYDFDMYHDPRLLADLHEGFETVIREAPSPFYTPLNGGHWVITDITHADELLKDYEYFSTTLHAIPPVENPVSLLPLHFDPPTSTPYRQILMPAFSPKAVAGREAVLRGWVSQFIDAVVDKGRCEFVMDVSSRFPVTVFMQLMGIPFALFDCYRALSDEFFQDVPEERLAELSQEIYREMELLIDARMEKRSDDLISELIDSKIDGRAITRDELKSMLFLLFLAGLDTVVNVMTFSFRELAKDPALQKRLVDNPGDIPSFVEEGLRLFGTVNSPRVVIKDCDRYGVKFRKGDMILNLNSQFGRDPRQNPDPKKLDLDRERRVLLPFATGPHLCVGHNLARSEIRILTEEWLKRIPSFRIAQPYQPEYRLGMVMALRSLPLEWDVPKPN